MGSRLGRSALIAVIASVWLLTQPGSLGAQPGSARAPLSTTAGADTTTLNRAADEYAGEVQAAVDAYERHELAESRKHFARAHQLLPSARTYRGLGITAFGLGLYAEAAEEFRHALSDQRRPLTSELRAEAEGMLQQAKARVGHAPSDAEVSANALPSLQPSAAAGGATSRDLEHDHRAAGRAASSSGFGVQTALAIAAGAVGVAGVITGSVFGVRSVSQGDVRDQSCRANVCSDERGYRAGQEAVQAGNISTVAFIVGAVGLAGGVVLWATDFSGTPGSAERADKQRASTRVRLGLASLGVESRW